MVNYMDVGGYRVPVYAQDAFNFTPATREMTDFGWERDTGPARFAFKGLESGTGYDADSWYNPANWQTVGDMGQTDPSAGFLGTLKVGEKEGAQFRYSLKDGEYVPEYVGNVAWDTNPSDRNRAAIAMATIVAGGLLAGAGAGAGAGGMQGWQGMGLMDAGAAGLPASSGGWVGGVGGVGGSSLGNLSGFDAPWPTGMTEGMSGGGLGGSLGQVGEFLAKNPSLVRLGATTIGGLLGSNGSGGSGGAQGGPTPATNVQVPTLYGGGSGGGLGGSAGGLFNLGQQGPTQTEAMFRSYLPGLFGGGGMARTNIPQRTQPVADKADLRTGFWPRDWS